MYNSPVQSATRFVNRTLPIRDRYVDFIFTGPTNAFWRNLSGISFDRVSTECAESIDQVVTGVQSDYQWAYQSNWNCFPFGQQICN
jgi:hypothetical protein